MGDFQIAPKVWEPPQCGEFFDAFVANRGAKAAPTFEADVIHSDISKSSRD
jgi:hypothetical protein